MKTDYHAIHKRRPDSNFINGLKKHSHTLMKKILIIISILVLALITSLIIDSRSTAMFLINTSVKIGSSSTTENNIRYGNKEWQKLNLHIPTDQSSKLPVLVFVHGGGWHSGTKDQYYFVAEAFTRLGYLVVVPDYIKYPEGRFPAFVEDISETIVWVKNNISQYNGDPATIFLSGHSAGAHSGALLVSNEQYLQNIGLDVRDIKGFAGVSGPYNFTPKWPQYIETFGRENFETMKVNSHINGNEPPMLLIHSQGDTAVHPFNYETLTEKLKSVGNDVQNIIYGEEVDHITIVLKMHPWFANEVNVAKDIDTFFKSL